MDELVVGLDLCDAYTKVSCLEEEKTWTIPTVICKKKNFDEWYIGEEAYGYALNGEGIIVDNLTKIVIKEGTSTIEGTKYEGIELLWRFLQKVMELPRKEFGVSQISCIVIALSNMHVKLMDSLLICTDYLEISRQRVHLISHIESFIYYVASQKRELWINQVGMFDLNQDELRYYEMKVQRGTKQLTILAEYETLEESFNLDILENSSGARLADKIISSSGERLLQKKLFSSIFLTGKGFLTQDWAVDFMKLICSKRKVYIEPDIFSKGAAYKALDDMHEKTAYPFVCICEGRLSVSISITVLHKDRENQLMIAAAGDSWYESKKSVDLLLNDQNYIEFLIVPTDSKKKTVKILLEDFPVRPNRTTKVSVKIGFLDEKTMEVVIQDKGFGELYPATDAVIRQEVML